MTATPKPLPQRWTIKLHTVLNLTILTLYDAAGVHREIGFHSLTPPGTPDRTVTALTDIPEPELRDAAQKLIDTFYERTAQVQANADAFDAAVPDCSELLDRLSATADASVTAHLGVDDEALTLVLTLTATGPAAGTLYALITRWPCAGGAGVATDLDGDDLTVRLDQERAEAFLTWYRDQP